MAPRTRHRPIALLTSVLLGIAGGAAPAQATQLVAHAGHYYGVTPPSSWSAATQFAFARGGTLVTIDTAAENTFLTEYFVASRPAEPFWIGLVARGPSYLNTAQWYWLSRTPVTYTNWRIGQPDSGTGFDRFAVMNYGMNGGVWDNLPAAGYMGVPYGVYELPVPLHNSWVDLQGSAGAMGATPHLTGGGNVIGGATATLTLSSGPPLAFGLLLVAATAAPVPAFGGTLFASSSPVVNAWPTDAMGGQTTTFVWPPPAVGQTFCFQALYVDVAAPTGFALSNGLYAVF